MLWFDRHRRFRDRLSGYIDARLSLKEARAVDAHLEGCAACRRELDELRATVVAVGDLLVIEVPRSFTLSPEQVARPMPLPLLSTPPLAMGMRLAGAALAFSLAVVLVADFGDFSGNGGGGGRDFAATQESGDDDADALRLSQEADGGGAPAAADVSPGEANDASKTLGAADAECSVATHNNGPFAPADTPAVTGVPEAIAEPTAEQVAVAQPEDSRCVADGTAAYSAESPTRDPIAELDVTIAEDLALDRPSDAKDSLSTLRWLEIALAAALVVVLAGLAGSVTGARRR